MKHEEIYNNIRTTVGILLLAVMFTTSSCEDNVVQEETVLEPSMQMWVNGDQINPYSYYGQINTYGEKTLGEDGKIRLPENMYSAGWCNRVWDIDLDKLEPLEN